MSRTPLVTWFAVRQRLAIGAGMPDRSPWRADYVEPVRFLLSPATSFITGQTLVIDGGSIRH